MRKRRIVFRADGNKEIGLGHIVRCIALASLLKHTFKLVFISNKLLEKQKALIAPICKLIELESNDLHDELKELAAILDSNDILVIDGYFFDESYQLTVKQLVHKLVMIDDLIAIHCYAHLIINHGGECLKQNYRKEPYTKVLVGFDYLLVRQAFLNSAKKVITTKKAIQTAFVCMGGADPLNITVKVVTACIKAGVFHTIIIVLGGAYSNREELLELINEYKKDFDLRLEENVDAETMVGLISSSDICICPSSSISLEVCCVTSGLLTGTTIDNQDGVHNQLIKNRCCVSLSDFNSSTIEDIMVALKLIADVNVVNELIKNQKKAVDGLSSERLLKQFKLLSEC